MSQDLPLEYVHVEPSAATPGPDPVVFVMHGRGADEEDLVPLTREFPGAYHVVSLRAPDPLMGGYTWYELDLSAGGLHASQPHAEQFRRSLDLVAESVDIAVDRFGFDPDRVGLLGFSQGAIMTFSLLVERPERYAWVVGLHGYLAASHADRDPAGLAGKPVFVGAGNGDQVIPAGRAEAAADRLRELGADVTFSAFDAPHGVGPDEHAAVVEFVAARSAAAGD